MIDKIQSKFVEDLRNYLYLCSLKVKIKQKRQ